MASSLPSGSAARWQIPALLLALFLVGGDAAYAQVDPQLAPYNPGATCDLFVTVWPDDYRPSHSSQAANIATLTTCIDALARVLVQLPNASRSQVLETEGSSQRAQPGESGPADAAVAAVDAVNRRTSELQDLHQTLRKLYLAYTRIRRWVDKLSPRVENADHVALHVEYQRFSEALSIALKAANLSRPFSASLLTGFSIQEAGGNGTAEVGTSAGGVGLLAFESMHFFAQPNAVFDLGISGTLGFRPALVVVEPAEGEEVDADRYAEYRQGFAWSVYVEPNFRLADLLEVSGFAGIGQHVVSGTSSLIEDGGTAVVSVLSGRQDAGATFYETGVKLSIYSESLDLLHLSQGLVSPAFGFAAGLRWDERFADIELPEDAGVPTRRVFVRVSTSALPVDRLQAKGSPFTLTFALEHEHALTRSPGAISQGTRVLIRGDLSLFRTAD